MKTLICGAPRVLTQLVLAAGLLSATACGGQMAFSGNINVSGTKPPEAPKKSSRVEVKADKIEIHETIHFAKREATIESDSFSLMDEIAQVFKDNPRIKKVLVEGHTDSDGSESYNLDLSSSRAKAVVAYLVQHGVDASRLTAKGFGESKPIASNDTPEGMTKNRRVEFTITKQDPAEK